MKNKREIAVIDAAIEQVKNGFVTDAYLKRKDSNVFTFQTPGPDVVAACAIGGIEQAIWKVTGEAPERKGDHRPVSRHSLFGRVLGKCNRITREKYGRRWPTYGPVADIEQLTFAAKDDKEAQTLVLRVLRAAKREYKAAATA